ncbi:MAG: FtsW/RodA/SpoVE family cell cycle protein [Myxococcota bacterium]
MIGSSRYGGSGGGSPSRMGGMDFTPLLAALSVATVGIINLSSAAQVTAPNLFLAQALWVFFGVCFAIAVGLSDYRVLERVAVPFYFLVIFLLAMVLVKGRSIMGAKRWIGLGPVNLQPSELMKLAIILFMARYLANWEVPGGYTLRELVRPLNVSRPLGALVFLAVKWKKLAAATVTVPKVGWTLEGGTLGGMLVGVIMLWLVVALFKVAREGFPPRSVVAPMDVIAVPGGLILVQPDLGTASINVAIALSMLLFCGMRPASLAISAVIAVAGSVVAWFTVLKEYQKKRVLTFLNPEADALGAGYHANQSMIAIGSGGTEGKGFKAGTQTQLSFLPENHTDFVFSVLGEEWGLVGGVVLIILFFFLLWAGINVASKARDRFGALLSVGVAAFIFWHVFVNIGMVTGTLPVVGVTLPLMSYGGSSVIAIMGGVGIWLSVSARRGR